MMTHLSHVARRSQRVLTLSLAALALTAPSTLGQNLLTNGDAEAGLAGWTATNGFATNSAITYEGDASFHAGTFGPSGAWTSRLSQDVDLTAYAAGIDAGEASLTFTGRARSNSAGGTTDFASLDLRVLDALGTELSVWNSGNVTPTNTWVLVERPVTLPAQARTLRVTLIGQRTSFASTDAFFDALSVSVPTYPLGAAYCTAVANSTGNGATLRAVGSDLVTDNHVRLEAAQLPPNTLGYFITSLTQGSAPGVGGSQGTLCVVGSVGRFNAASQVGQSSATGELALTLDLTTFPTPLGFVAVAAGDTWNFQTWYRDANPANTSNFSEAYSVLFR